MSSILMKATVLVLNRNWQAINVRAPQEAFCMMATNIATGLEIEGENHIRPVTWEEWITLPIRPQDNAAHGMHGVVLRPNRQRDPLLPGNGTDMVLAFDLQAGRNIRGHLAKCLLWRANVNCLLVSVEYVHNR